MSHTSVLLSWLARNNDPFRDENRSQPGPTITILFDPDSSYQDEVEDVVLLLHRDDEIIGEETKKSIHKRRDNINVHLKYWNGEDPTDHRQIFDFLRSRINQIRRSFPDQELVINVSPGTPAMHTVWMLMAETGFIAKPFSVVQTVPRMYRDGGSATVSAEIGIDSFYKAYQESRPKEVASEEDRVLWDPAKFKSEKLKSVFEKARRYASLKVPILIHGERGTGKTTLANWIRNTSPFRNEDLDQGWPSVPCGQYEPETMRSELFGYVKGAFTGADEDTEGLLHKADGDTLFLDEIGDVSPSLQRLLIRALEDRKFYRVGSKTPEESDFRLLTATNQPLDELYENLDADFMDRIGAFTLRMPPLREIPEDLGWIWKSVIDMAAERAGIPTEEVSLNERSHEHIRDSVADHPLPGNLRDLFRVAYHLIALLQDTECELSQRESCTRAVEAGLDDIYVSTDIGVARDVAAAFADRQPLNPLIERHGSINSELVLDKLKQFIAGELRRISERQDVDVERLFDKSERTLLNWSQT